MHKKFFAAGVAWVAFASPSLSVASNGYAPVKTGHFDSSVTQVFVGSSFDYEYAESPCVMDVQPLSAEGRYRIQLSIQGGKESYSIDYTAPAGGDRGSDGAFSGISACSNASKSTDSTSKFDGTLGRDQLFGYCGGAPELDVGSLADEARYATSLLNASLSFDVIRGPEGITLGAPHGFVRKGLGLVKLTTSHFACSFKM